MRIIYHHRTLGDGAEGIHIREMVSALRNLGHVVRVVSLIGERVETWQTGSSAKQQVWSWISRVLPDIVYECAEVRYNFVGQRSVRRTIREFHWNSTTNKLMHEIGGSCDRKLARTMGKA